MAAKGSVQTPCLPPPHPQTGPVPVGLYLNGLRGLQGLLRRDAHLPVPQQLLDEVRDVPARDWDVLDAASDDVAFRLRGQGQGAGKGPGGGTRGTRPA